jgi:hypothetical protein
MLLGSSGLIVRNIKAAWDAALPEVLDSGNPVIDMLG